MAKLTIDDKEYETDDFTEEQVSLYNEIMYVNGQMQQKDYMLKILDARKSFLAQALADSLSNDDTKGTSE